MFWLYARAHHSQDSVFSDYMQGPTTTRNQYVLIICKDPPPLVINQYFLILCKDLFLINNLISSYLIMFKQSQLFPPLRINQKDKELSRSGHIWYIKISLWGMLNMIYTLWVAHRFLESCQRKWKENVEINETNSDSLTLLTGVSQGTILSPLHLIIYSSMI